MMEWLASNWQQVLPLAGVLVAWLLNTRFAGSVKLRFGRANNSFHTVAGANGDPAAVYCEKFYLQNSGIRAASNVEVSFSRPPTALTTFPPLDYEAKINPDGEYIMKISSISPRELVIIDTIHVNTPTAEVVSVRCPDAVGKRVNFWVTRKFSNATNVGITAIMALGVYYALYLVVVALTRALGWQ